MWQLESQSYAYINGHYFLCVGSETKIDQISFQITRDVENEDPTSWVDQETLDTIFIFADKWSLDHVFIEVGPFFVLEVLSSEEDKRLYSKYD